LQLRLSGARGTPILRQKLVEQPIPVRAVVTVPTSNVTLISYYFDAKAQGYVNRMPVRSAAAGQGQPSLTQRNETVTGILNSSSMGEGAISTSTGGSRNIGVQTGE
jgi:hypothetical protein